MNNYLKFFLSIPKTLVANFKYLPFTQAVRFPIIVSYRTKLLGGGKITLRGDLKLGMFRVGFHEVPICDFRDKTILNIKGELICNGIFHVGNGAKIRITDRAVLAVGNNFGISASSTINCYKKITVGDDVLFAWGCLVMDSDTHPIYDEDDKLINANKEIVIEDKVWVGCNTIILKGTHIPRNCVVGAGSIVSGHNFTSNTIVTGNPAKSGKHIGTWSEHLKNSETL